MAQANFSVEVLQVRPLTDRVNEYLLGSVDGQALPVYQAGAHIAVHFSAAGYGPLVRHYSLLGGADSQDDARQQYRIAVQREAHGVGSGAIHAQFAVGTRLSVGAPVNNFPLKRRNSHVLLIAGGIGITPIWAMARSLQRRQQSFSVFYAGQNTGSMAYHDALQKLVGEKVRLHYSDAQGVPDLKALLVAQPEGSSVYVCGPAAMIAATHAAGEALGWDAERIRSEQFAATQSEPPAPMEVHLRKSGKTIAVGAGQSILDALLAEGEPVLWDCRRGECGLCPLPVVETDGPLIHNDRYLSNEEKAQGQSMCICVSRVRGTRVVLDA